ncbi:unnamed protein product, partial [marine sediment metagenome]
GKLIAFYQKADAGYQICTMRPDGSNFIIITKFLAGIIATVPSWSPDSKKLAFIRNRQIFIIDVDSKNLYQLPKTKSADYEQVYFITNNRLLALKAEGGSAHLVLIDIKEEISVRTR